MAQANLSEPSSVATDEGFEVANVGRPVGNYHVSSVTNAITATASAGVAITGEINIVTSNDTSTKGVQLDSKVLNGMQQRVINTSGTIITVYPPTGGTVDGGSVNAGVTIAATANSGKTFLQTGSLTYVTSSLT